MCSLASLKPWINLLAAAEGSPASPHLLPPMEPSPPLCLVWLNLAFSAGSSSFAGFLFWQLCKLIKLWWGQWAIRLAQLLLVKPHLLLKPAPALQNLCSCSHSSRDREVLSGDDNMIPANTFLWPPLLPRWFYARQGIISLLVSKGMNSSHATISNYYMPAQETSQVNLSVLPAALC